ncbi:exodeoxyribonuclease VII small subunit [bacterium]|nr:exodeoxyribonuclease VII small subunit [bacterium]
MSKLTYEKAQLELQEILKVLEFEQPGIDELNKKLKRAAELIKYCKQKLRETQTSVDEIIDSIDEEG